MFFSNIINYGSWQHIVLIFAIILITFLLVILTKKANDRIKKIILIIVWAVMLINLFVYDIINLAKFQKNVVMYHPVEYFEAYVFGGLVIAPIILMGFCIFSKKRTIPYLFTFYITLLIGILSLVIKAPSLDGFGSRFMNLGGFQIGIVTNSSYIFYAIKVFGYILFPILLVVYKYYKPQFKDLPKTLLILMVCFGIAYFYNWAMLKSHLRINTFGTFPNLKEYRSNVLYASIANFKLLQFFKKGLGFFYIFGIIPLVLVLWIIMTTPFYNIKKYLKTYPSTLRNYFKEVKKYWLNFFTRPVDYEDLVESVNQNE